MMNKKTWTVLFFLIVFGLPVSWYLFLQLFGENKFDLPRIAQWDQGCLELSSSPVLVVSERFRDSFPNEFSRIERKVDDEQVYELRITDLSSCKGDFSIYLIDEELWIRGQFESSREEVDRLLAEMDIYLLNQRNEPDNRSK